MKRNENFVLEKIGDSFALIPFGEATVNLNGVVTLNETAKFLWDHATEGFNEDSLTAALLAEYEVDDAAAHKSVKHFIETLKEAGCIE